MDDLVHPYDADHDLSSCYLPYEDLAQPAHIHDHKLSRHQAHSGELLQDAESRRADIATKSSDEVHGDGDLEERPLQVAEEPPKKASISRSTYFRAKRNLKSHGSVRSASSGKQIGRPQKLDANAEKVCPCERFAAIVCCRIWC